MIKNKRMTKKIAGALMALTLLIVLLVALYLFAGGEKSEKAAPEWARVTATPLILPLRIMGRLESASFEVMSAPFDGIVEERFVQEGQKVDAGKPIIRFDTAQIDILEREAMSNLLKAERTAKELAHWNKSQEVMRAHRSLASATMALEDSKRKLADTRALFERGIVPRMEVEALEQQIKTQNLDLASAQTELAQVIEKGNKDSQKIAAIELDNTKARFKLLAEQKSKRELIAPYRGILVKIQGNSGDKNNESIQKGSKVAQGQALFAIASLENLNVVGKIEEMDINQIKEGQLAEISGDGFEGLILKGRVQTVGAQVIASNMGGTNYEVSLSVTLPESAEERQRLKLGMTANVAISSYQNPHALIVPHAALQQDKDGFFVEYKESLSASPQKKPVQIIKATPEGMDVTGIAPGFVLKKNTPVLGTLGASPFQLKPL